MGVAPHDDLSGCRPARRTDSQPDGLIERPRRVARAVEQRPCRELAAVGAHQEGLDRAASHRRRHHSGVHPQRECRHRGGTGVPGCGRPARRRGVAGCSVTTPGLVRSGNSGCSRNCGHWKLHGGGATLRRRRTAERTSHVPEWRNGRRRGLKIPRPRWACGFDSHLRHQSSALQRPLKGTPVSPAPRADGRGRLPPPAPVGSQHRVP